jgi:glycosyltransferase involved in cell wall biosynthesis
MAPFFSIVLCTYNRVHIVRRAIESVLLQTFQDWELIIVDDGSQDTTREVISDLVSSDPRISYYYEKNQGVALARDYGCAKASGKYFTFLDSDDEYHPTHLESRYEILIGTPAIELLHGGIEIIGSPYVADKFDPSKLIHLSECKIGGTFFIRRDLFLRSGGFGDIVYGDDNDFFIRAEAKGAFIEKTEIPTYRYYRTEPDSLCHIAEEKGIEGILEYRGVK